MKNYVQATCLVISINEEDILRTSLSNSGQGSGNEYDINDLIL